MSGHARARDIRPPKMCQILAGYHLDKWPFFRVTVQYLSSFVMDIPTHPFSSIAIQCSLLRHLHVRSTLLKVSPVFIMISSVPLS